MFLVLYVYLQSVFVVIILSYDGYKVWVDVEMIQVVMCYKYKFMIEVQVLLYGDFYLGLIMVIDMDIKVIDSEFGFMGLMVFDIGNYIGNFLLVYFLCSGWDVNE